MSGGAARLARRTRQRRERRYRRRIRRCIGCNTVDSGNVSSRLPQPDCGAATDAVSGPHRRHTTTAPAVGPQLRSTLRRGSDGRRDSRNIAALRHRPAIGAASEIRRILDQRLAAVRGLPHHRSSRGHVPRGSRPQSHRGFLVWTRTRTWRGQRAASGAGRIISKAVIQSTVLSVRNLLADITEWGWEQAPPRRLVFAVDVPRLDQPLPRALPPDIDVAVMNAVSGRDDSFDRIRLAVLRGAGLRVGELLDLELGTVIDYGPAGTWLKVTLV